MVSATTTNLAIIEAPLPHIERGGLRTIGEVLAEMLPRYTTDLARPTVRLTYASEAAATVIDNGPDD